MSGNHLFGPVTIEPTPDLSKLPQWTPIYSKGQVIFWRCERAGIYLGSVRQQGHFWKAEAFPPSTTAGKFLGFHERWDDAIQRVQDWWAEHDAKEDRGILL